MPRRHMCNICGKWDEWGPGWAWFGSIVSMENGRSIKVCSDTCKAEAEKELAERGWPFPEEDGP